MKFEEKAGFFLRMILFIVNKDEITFFGKARYRLNPEEHSLEIRLHSVFHLLEQKRDGIMWYINYFKGLISGYDGHKDEYQANLYAGIKIVDKGMNYVLFKMNDTEYVKYCYMRGL